MNWKHLRTFCKIFVGIVTGESITMIVLLIVYLTTTSEQNLEEGHIKFYTTIYIATTITVAIFAFLIVIYQNIFQLFTFAIAHVLLTSYMLYDFLTSTAKIRFGFLFLILICDALYIYTLWRIYFEVKWDFWQRAGTSSRMQTLYKLWSIFLNILQVNCMLDFILDLSSCALLFSFHSFGTYLDIFGMILVFIWFWVGYSAYKYEYPKRIYFFFGLSVLQPTWTIIKWAGFDIEGKNNSKYNTGPYNTYRGIAIVSLIARIAAIVFALIGFLHFGEGLKDRLLEKYMDENTFLTDPQIENTGIQNSDGDDDEDDDETSTEDF
ncbi:hypothetical protein M0811_03348 [Anaeramoeba ignava]|uniref:Uncharacterized protein n=1 Tax=Anaeramoeba ignava TaxID=1746090 RepID=A0A9Q0R5Q5_ANAIG|nr:hypothetical protein M0811_03348 [Anaeramoeba ignava]